MKSYLPGLLLLTIIVGCQNTARDEESVGSENAITSNDGKPLELRFEGAVLTGTDTTAKAAVLSQLEYTQGMLTTDVRGNAQFNHVKLTNIREVAEGDGGGTKRITYTAALPVIWQKNTTVPDEYAVALPSLGLP